MNKSDLEWLIELGHEGKQPHAPLLDRASEELERLQWTSQRRLEDLEAIERKAIELSREVKRLQAVEQAARSLIEDCGWNIPVLSQHGEYDIEGHLLMELAAALEGDS